MRSYIDVSWLAVDSVRISGGFMSDGVLAILVSVGNESYMLLVALLKLTISTGGGDFFNEDTSELLSIDDICKKRVHKL